MSIEKDTNMTRQIMNTMIQWHVDMGLTKRIHVVADATMFPVGLLEGQVNGLHQIILNLAAGAIVGFTYHEHAFSFHCGFQGQDVHLVVPYEAVLGFVIPTGEETANFFPIPNMERELLALKLIKAARQAEPLVAEPFAVHGVGTLEDADIMPTVEDLMHAKQKEVPTPAKEKAAPLLDFGPLGGLSVSRSTGRPKLTVIQGGKR